VSIQKASFNVQHLQHYQLLNMIHLVFSALCNKVHLWPLYTLPTAAVLTQSYSFSSGWPLRN